MYVVVALKQAQVRIRRQSLEVKRYAACELLSRSLVAKAPHLEFVTLGYRLLYISTNVASRHIEPKFPYLDQET